MFSPILLCALCGKLSGRFLRSFQSHFQGRSPLSPSSATMLFTAFHCARSLFFQPQGSRSTSDSGTTPAKKSMLEKHHDEKSAKAHSTWSTIRANKLQTFYDKLNLSARYPAARMDGRSLVCFLISSLVFFCHSKTYSRWPTFSPRNSADRVPRE